MGLREKTDFNLQIISLGCAILVILVLSASRYYTSDWRERRLFKRQLAETQQRLLSKQDERKAEDIRSDKSRGSKKRRWKRFIAALPLMPLATAYIAVRLGWDVFELLVFCSIDFFKAMAMRSLVVARGLIGGLGALGRRVEIGRRLGDAFVLVIERTVVWIFGVFFPCIGDLISRCSQQAAVFAAWWSDTGGPLAAEYVELVVLQGFVPAIAGFADGLTRVYHRTLWLGSRVFKALCVLGSDILHDMLILYNWVNRMHRWMASAERWWFDPQIRAKIIACFAPMQHSLHTAYKLFAHRFVPQAMHYALRLFELGVYRCLLPLTIWCIDLTDHMVQTTVEMLVLGADLFLRGYALFAQSMAVAANACCQMYTAVSRHMHVVWQFLCIFQRWALRAWAGISGFVHRHLWIVAGLAYAYSQARETVFLPAVRLAIRASRILWLKILGPAALYLQSLVVDWMWPRTRQMAEHVWQQISNIVDWQHVQTMLSTCWLRTSMSIAAAYEWMAESAFADYLQRAMAQLAVALRYQTNTVLALMWPLVRRSWTDASQAMYDLYAQLVSAVDVVVAMVGDFIVEYAQSNAVHGRAAESEQTDVFSK
ncbi:hypothetical protein LPJ64_003396 [Coemansia asiatica]|uniref:Uncharacterized protein n=1 Tax=Coemansia asiatica TaxID=1052880 RepID=A0A9W7XKY0_9FUNG|nr:hypothetical protein LPJ64_003396 [Coemansia asiatica]